jgi:hypothetical protein
MLASGGWTRHAPSATALPHISTPTRITPARPAPTSSATDESASVCRFPSCWRGVFGVWADGAGMDADGFSLRGRMVCGTAFSTLWASVWRRCVAQACRKVPTRTQCRQRRAIPTHACLPRLLDRQTLDPRSSGPRPGFVPTRDLCDLYGLAPCLKHRFRHPAHASLARPPKR